MTAYSTSPGKPATKFAAAATMASGRRQCIGASGRTMPTRSATVGSSAAERGVVCRRSRFTGKILALQEVVGRLCGSGDGLGL